MDRLVLNDNVRTPRQLLRQATSKLGFGWTRRGFGNCPRDGSTASADDRERIARPIHERTASAACQGHGARATSERAASAGCQRNGRSDTREQTALADWAAGAGCAKRRRKWLRPGAATQGDATRTRGRLRPKSTGAEHAEATNRAGFGRPSLARMHVVGDELGAPRGSVAPAFGSAKAPPGQLAPRFDGPSRFTPYAGGYFALLLGIPCLLRGQRMSANFADGAIRTVRARHESEHLRRGWSPGHTLKPGQSLREETLFGFPRSYLVRETQEKPCSR